MIVRNLFRPLIQHLSKKEFTVMTGARQTGKSTLLKQLDEHCQKMGMPTIFLNLENKDVVTHLNESPLNLLSHLPVTEERTVVFIDDIQNLQDPVNFLKLLYDESAEKIKIVAAGSKAFNMDRSFNDSLAFQVFWLRTCSFDEYLQLKDMPDLLKEVTRLRTLKTAKSLYIHILKHEWDAYMLYGGYPTVITEPDEQAKIERLADIRDSYLKRDIQDTDIPNETTLYQLFRILAGQSGDLLNIQELSVTLNEKPETIERLVAILQNCFYISLVKPFYRNVRKEITNMSKVYLLDTGMLNSLVNNFKPIIRRADNGMIWETMCYKLLCERYRPKDILFWRTTGGTEVDFVLPYMEIPCAMDIKYDKASIKPAQYKRFNKTYPEISLSFGWIQPFDDDFFRR
jgi:predicted AAA+ superfamily ATPase